VYERLTPKGQRPSFFTLSATQLVSAVWHGLFPGYPLFFISAAVLFNTSTVLYKIEQNKFPGGCLPAA
jgi:lysophospholipid acyltransferase